MDPEGANQKLSKSLKNSSVIEEKSSQTTGTMLICSEGTELNYGKHPTTPQTGGKPVHLNATKAANWEGATALASMAQAISPAHQMRLRVCSVRTTTKFFVLLP